MALIPNVLTHLRNDAEVFAAFGNRITPDKLPDTPTYPCARIWIVSSPTKYSHQGSSSNKTLLQLDIWDTTPSGVDTNLEILKRSLSGYRGMMGDMEVGYVFVKTVNTSWDAPAREYHRMLEVEIATNG